MMLEEFIKRTEQLQAKLRAQENLLKELDQIKELALLGIKREEIKYQRKKKVCRYGRLFDTGFAEVILKDGTHHTVPDHLLIWDD